MGNSSDSYGGGFCAGDYFADSGVKASFNRNTFRNNTSVGSGGGAYLYEAVYYSRDFEFNDNAFTGNVSSNGYGGGAYIEYIDEAPNAQMRRNVFTNNVACYGGGGLAIEYVEYGSELDFSSNLIQRNRLTGASGYGAGLYICEVEEGSILAMDDCVVSDNYGAEWGGGLFVYYMYSGGELRVTDCEFQRNRALYGGGICFYDEHEYGSLAVIEDCSITTDRNFLSSTSKVPRP